MMARKYSTNFERDFDFYLSNLNQFTFCGTLTPKHKAIYDSEGKSAKEAFFLIDSSGKNCPTYESNLLDSLLLCKASVNFHIKMWAECRAEGTLPAHEFSGDGETLAWIKSSDGNFDAIYSKSMKEVYNFPEWVIRAVEAQKMKLIQNI